LKQCIETTHRSLVNCNMIRFQKSPIFARVLLQKSPTWKTSLCNSGSLPPGSSFGNPLKDKTTPRIRAQTNEAYSHTNETYSHTKETNSQTKRPFTQKTRPFHIQKQDQPFWGGGVSNNMPTYT